MKPEYQITIIIILLVIVFIVIFLIKKEPKKNTSPPIINPIPSEPNKPKEPKKPKKPKDDPNYEEKFNKALINCSTKRHFIIKYKDDSYECLEKFDMLTFERREGVNAHLAEVSFSNFMYTNNVNIVYLNFHLDTGKLYTIPYVNYLTEKNNKEEYIKQYFVQGMILKNVKVNGTIFDVYLPKIKSNDPLEKEELKYFKENKLSYW